MARRTVQFMTADTPTPGGGRAAGAAGSGSPWERIERQDSPVGSLLFGLLVGLAVAGAGVWAFFMFNPVMVEPTRVQATLGGLNATQSTGRSGGLVCQPTFVFTGKDGKEYVSTVRAASSSLCGIRPGEPVEIIYDAADPAVVGAVDAAGVLFPVLAATAGFGVAAYSVAVFRRKRRAGAPV